MKTKQIPLPPALATVAFGAQLLLTRLRPRSARSTLGAAIVWAASGWLMVAALTRFRDRHTTVHPTDLNPTALIDDGPFQLTRNPIYVGLVGTLVGFAILRRSLWALIPAGLFAVAVDRIQIPAEEAALEEAFGPEYDRYRVTTPRWLGVIRPHEVDEANF